MCTLYFLCTFTVVYTKVISKQDAGTSTDDSDFDKVEQCNTSVVRRNAHGQIKTNCNVKRIKPPLPPMKKTPKAPLRRSAQNQAKISQEVQYSIHFKSIRKKSLALFMIISLIECVISLRYKYSYSIECLGIM